MLFTWKLKYSMAMLTRRMKTFLLLAVLLMSLPCWLTCSWGDSGGCWQLADQIFNSTASNQTFDCCHQTELPDSAQNTSADCCLSEVAVIDGKNETPSYYVCQNVIGTSNFQPNPIKAILCLGLGFYPTPKLLDSVLNFCSPRSPPLSLPS